MMRRELSWRRRWRCPAGCALVLLSLFGNGLAVAQVCPGDCDDSGRVTVDELVRGVNIALGRADLGSCAVLDADDDRVVRVNELVGAVARALGGCNSPVATETPTVAAPSTPTPTATVIPSASATSSPSQTPSDGSIAIADIVQRDAHGLALRLGERVTAKGIVTVSAGTFGNSLLKIYIQRDDEAVKVFHQTSANVAAFQRGQELLVTGIVRQIDSVGGDVREDGTIQIDISSGSAQVLSSGNPLPTPAIVTLTQLSQNVALTGRLVQVAAIHKVDGEFPKLGDRSTQITVGDDSGTTLPMRFQRPIITTQLADELAAIGEGSFTATAIAVQEDHDPSGDRLAGMQLWVRGTDDINPSRAAIAAARERNVR